MIYLMQFMKYFIFLYLPSMYWYTNLMTDPFPLPPPPRGGLNVSKFKSFPPGVEELQFMYLLDLQLLVLREGNSFFYSLLLMPESLWPYGILQHLEGRAMAKSISFTISSAD